MPGKPCSPMNRPGSKTRLNEIDERCLIRLCFSNRNPPVIGGTCDHHRGLMPKTAVTGDFKLDRINTMIKRETFDHGLKHHPEMLATPSGPAQFDSSDPIRKIGPLEPDANDASSRFQIFESTSDTMQKIRDREFDRLTRTNRTIEFDAL